MSPESGPLLSKLIIDVTNNQVDLSI